MSGKYTGNTSIAGHADLDALWAQVPGAGVIAGILADIAAIEAELALLGAGETAKFTANAGAGPLVAAAGDLTGSAFVAALYSGVNGSTLTTRTAAQMIADAVLAIGASWHVRILNTAAGTLTLTAGAGVTINGTAAVASGSWVDYVVTVTGAGAVTFQSAGAPGAGGSQKFRTPFVYGDPNTTGPGSFTHTVSAGVTKIEIEAWGGGAGATLSTGTNPYSAGGAGAYVWARKTVTPGQTIDIVVGAGAGVNDPALPGADTTADATGIIAGGGFPPNRSVGTVVGGAGGLAQWDAGYVDVARGITGGAGTDYTGPVSVVSTLGPAGVIRGGDSPLGGTGGLYSNFLGSSEDGDGGTGTKLGQSNQNPNYPGGGAATGQTAAGGLLIVWEYQ